MTAEQFEERFGTTDLLKAGFSALTKTLVSKGIITEADLMEAFEREMLDRQEPKVCAFCGHIDAPDVLKCDECGADMP